MTSAASSPSQVPESRELPPLGTDVFYAVHFTNDSRPTFGRRRVGNRERFFDGLRRWHRDNTVVEVFDSPAEQDAARRAAEDYWGSVTLDYHN